MSDWQERYAEHLMNSYGPPKLELARGEGAHVWDSEGREYVDFLGGIAVNALGHAHPALVSAVTTQLQTLGHVSNFFATEPQIRLAERLLDMVGQPGRVFFANSGAEANEAALKATRRTGRSHVVATEAGFHGRTLGALSLTHKPAAREPFEPLPGDVTFVPYGDAEALSAAVGDHTAAVVLEPIQGEAGVVPAPPGYLAHARAVTRAHGALLWLDEVQTGIGRTGAWLAHQLLEPGVVPDLVTLAKGLAGGMPIGACVAVGEAGDLLGPGSHGTTFGGNPVSAAAAHAVLDTIEADDLMARATRLGEVLRDGLGADERVVAVRGHGLLVGLELAGEAGPAVVQAAQDAGFILNATGPTRIRLAPPLVLTDADAEALVAAWPAILDAAGVGGAEPS